MNVFRAFENKDPINPRPHFPEGLKDRSAFSKILPQISTLKDNCYHLRRHLWNDVNEDWPFYSEEEKRMLKRSVILSFNVEILCLASKGDWAVRALVNPFRD